MSASTPVEPYSDDPLGKLADAENWPTSDWTVEIGMPGGRGKVVVTVEARTPLEACREAAKFLGDMSVVDPEPAATYWTCPACKTKNGYAAEAIQFGEILRCGFCQRVKE